MRGRVLFASLLTASGLLVANATSMEANASVGDYSQQVRLRQEAPNAGYYGTQAYRDVLTSQQAYCGRAGQCYYYTRGGIQTKLATYRVVEDMSADFYVVTATVVLSHSSGTGGVSNLYVDLKTSGSVIDYTDTAGKSGPSNSCVTVNLGISKSLGPFGAGASLGSFRSCSEAASISRTSASASLAAYKVHHFNKVNQVVITRVVKVSHGTTPTFRLNLGVRKDVCNRTFTAGLVHCIDPGGQYTATASYGIGTTPE